MPKPTTTGKPATLPGRRVGIHRKAGTEAPAAGRQNLLAPGTARRPLASTNTAPSTGVASAAARAKAAAMPKGKKK